MHGKAIFYRRVDAHLFHPYVWVKAIKHIDEREHTVMITLHQEQSVYPSVLKMKQELDKKRKRSPDSSGIRFLY